MDIIANKNDPPDVVFGDANFEIMELYEVGRKRHDEFHERLKELKQAKTVDETLIPIKWPKPIPYGFIFDELCYLSSQIFGNKIRHPKSQ